MKDKREHWWYQK